MSVRAFGCLFFLLSLTVASRVVLSNPNGVAMKNQIELREASSSSSLVAARQTRSIGNNDSSNVYRIHVAAIHIDKSEFPLSKLLFKLTLQLALESVNKNLEPSRVQLTLSVRSANTCSRQFAGAVAAEEYYARRARLFVVSGCDAAIRSVSRLASGWRVPVLTAAGFGLDLNDKSIHKTLIRVAFSLRSAVEFLVKILKSFQWRQVNLIVDKSDPNSWALKQTIERLLIEYNNSNNNNKTGALAANSSESLFVVSLNTIEVDLQMLTSLGELELARSAGNSYTNNKSHGHNRLADNREVAPVHGYLNEDKWPNSITERAIQDALRQSSLFSRVNILLIPHNYLRKFMLSVHDQGMANGLYTFINMPLLQLANDDQTADQSSTSANQSKHQSFGTSAGKNVFVWREQDSSRNAQAKQAFESLMSIHLRTPTSKAYVYFASKLSNFANVERATSVTSDGDTIDANNGSTMNGSNQRHLSAKFQLSIDPYSASFYDCLQIYAIALQDSLLAIAAKGLQQDSTKMKMKLLKRNFHAQISDQLRNRRFDNMVTGIILINQNGDRDTEYTLDDLNQMTGKFSPVILYKSENKQIVRLAKIQWSSDESVGPTIDAVDCNLTASCQSKPISKFFFTLVLLTIPLGAIMSALVYLIYTHLSLESQLVDYWWKINFKDIELIDVRRKNAGEGTSSVGMSAAGSHGSSASKLQRPSGDSFELAIETGGSEFAKTTITKATNTSGFNSSAADVCYGDISLGIYKLAKVSLKPMAKFRQTRKLMIELRTLKRLNHDNLSRFVGIVVEQPNSAFVSEFCSKGSLREFFQHESMAIDLTFKYSIINDIMAGLLYLHSSDVGFHGRLKSSNCLVSSRFIVKLSDYGLNSLYDYLDENEDEETLMKKRVCLAPEHLKIVGKSGCSKKGDVYSFGLILYEIITNNIPFYNAEKTDFIIPLKTLVDELRTSGPTGKLQLDLSQVDVSQGNIQALMDLMKRCLQFEVSKRPSSASLASTIKAITRGVTSKKLLENLTSRMEQYTNNLESLVDAKLATLVEEKHKTEELLYQFVPRSIAFLLKEGQSIEPEAFDCVTVFYSDIVGFTSLSSESSPMEVIDFLSNLYLCFDETLEQYDIYKVDTIGDAYIVASGLPQPNDGKHVIEVARAALDLRDRLARFKIPHRPERSLEMRVGIHSGPCIAGIVGGLNMPKYCVFGDTVSTGRFMESSGLPMKIHITEESKNLLEEIGADEFNIEARVPRVNKDGLPFQTYWLEERSRSC